MDYIIIDLEWNQPTIPKKRRAGLIGEIIQIGAAKVDVNMQVLETFNEIIKPQYYHKMNGDIGKLTHITNEEIDSGKLFKDVVESFKTWCGDDFVFISWGPEDTRVLENNLIEFGLDTAWLPETYDGQLMFDDQEMQEDRQWPLNYGLYHYNEKPDGQHNALADVYSTALVLKHLDMGYCLQDEYFICYPYYDDDTYTS